jgi:hypothetical protein
VFCHSPSVLSDEDDEQFEMDSMDLDLQEVSRYDPDMLIHMLTNTLDKLHLFTPKNALQDRGCSLSYGNIKNNLDANVLTL